MEITAPNIPTSLVQPIVTAPASARFCSHPSLLARQNDICKWRLVLKSGTEFVQKYLRKFSAKESDNDFASRLSITYCSAHAKAALIQVKNSIYQRFVDIERRGGPQSYQLAVTGSEAAVDRKGNSMNSFIGMEVLLEMIGMEKIGVFVDKPVIKAGATKAETRGLIPYLYTYRAEDILNWQEDEDGELISVLLQDHVYKYDDITKLATSCEVEHRLIRKIDAKHVEITYYDAQDKPLVDKTIKLQLSTLPFVIFQISDSLLVDIADYQIALTNLGSSDLNYVTKANFPFLTEQFDFRMDMPDIKQQITDVGGASTVGTADSKIGVSQGRRYPKGLERPMFIHPSSEPIKASMDKQEQMKQEILQLINLAVANVEPRRVSAKSVTQQNVGKEEGLSYIGLELEHGERQIAKIWADYENTEPATITYPVNYSLKTDDERRKEAKDLKELIASVPSKTYQKELAISIVQVTIGHKVSKTVMDKIVNEIEAAQVIVTDPDIVVADHEAGFVGTELASKARGYPPGEVEKAKADHAERAARIAAAQSSAANRGVNDLATGSANAEKANVKQQQSLDPNNKNPVRGKA